MNFRSREVYTAVSGCRFSNLPFIKHIKLVINVNMLLITAAAGAAAIAAATVDAAVADHQAFFTATNSLIRTTGRTVQNGTALFADWSSVCKSSSHEWVPADVPGCSCSAPSAITSCFCFGPLTCLEHALILLS